MFSRTFFPLLTATIWLLACGPTTMPLGGDFEGRPDAGAAEPDDAGAEPDDAGAEELNDAGAEPDDAGETDAGDLPGPQVAWLQPSQGATVSGVLEDQACTVEATGAAGIAQVMFLLDGSALGTDTAAPFTCRWDTTSASLGAHELTAVAYDELGRTATTSVIVVVERADLEVIWRTPVEGQTVSGLLNEPNANCEALVTASAGVDRVEFRLDGALLNTERSAPYSCLWDTTQSANGTYVLEAKAFDLDGRSASVAINVGVANAQVIGTEYYVSSSTGNDQNDGLALGRAWKTMAKVNSITFSPGDVVHFSGTIDDQPIGNPGRGTSAAPIVFVGDGPFDGRARIRGIALTNAEHLVFRNFEASGTAQYPNVVTARSTSAGRVQFVRFERLYIHDATEGVVAYTPRDSDLTFVDSDIRGMDQNGVLLGDEAGDRFTFIRGSIKDTGRRNPGYGVHGVYPSGGHGHLFDGVEFGDNANGWSLSIRRGNITVRNCRFRNQKMINNCNEDEGTTNPYTGSPSHHLTYWIYRNLFVGTVAGSTSIYQSNNNDHGVDDPQNTWLIFNNTFVDSVLNFGSARPSSPAIPGQLTTGYFADTYDIYLRNNLFVGGRVSVSPIRGSHVHALSHNGWWSLAPQGSHSVTSDPQLDAANTVTSPAYRDAGTAVISPLATMVPDFSDPMGYRGAAPDIGHSER